MNQKQRNAFQKDLAKFRDKYPECVVEAWTPADYETQTSKKLTTQDCLDIADRIYDRFDASIGINWDMVKDNIE